jgi:NAD(P)-dependent dehydrogenase (short-subunit alcohol dehydrogenase family)
MLLENKILVLTGNNGLLGTNMQNYLIAQGAMVIGLDIHQKNETNYNYICDITSEKHVDTAIEKINTQFGPINGWINNAYPRTEDWGLNVELVPYDSWKKNVDMHLNSYFMCSRKALHSMKENKNGSLINIASIYGMQAPDFSVYEGTSIDNPVGYAAIKGGIINLTRYLAAYYGRYNLRANCVSPGGIFDNQDPIFVKNYEKKVPLKRMGNADDIAPAIAFLLSDGAKYITGQNIAVDGGWSVI